MHNETPLRKFPSSFISRLGGVVVSRYFDFGNKQTGVVYRPASLAKRNMTISIVLAKPTIVWHIERAG